MTARREEGDQLLVRLEEMLVSIANLPDEEFPIGPDTGSEHRRTYRPTGRPRAITEKYWPELWQDVPHQKRSTDDRARSVIFKMRTYLRKFWGANDPYARDWYIHRAREYYQRLLVLPKTSERRKEAEQASTAEDARSAMSWLSMEIERILDEPPARNLIENALYHLQKRATKPSLAPRICQNDFCEQEKYFLSKKKGQKYCTLECARPSLLASKRKSYHKKEKGK